MLATLPDGRPSAALHKQKPKFFSDFLERRKHASFHNLLDQVRTHQPYIYQLFQVMVVFTNIGVAAGVSIILLRLMGTCGASTCQDVTINYRLLFHTYTGSSWVAGGIIVLVAGSAITCDYNIGRAIRKTETYVAEYREKLNKFLDEAMVKSAEFADGVIKTLMESTIYQRYGIILAVTDLLQQIRGQLFAFTYEVKHVQEGVKSMRTILISNGTGKASENLLELKGIKKVLTGSIIILITFVAVTVGGMVIGFTMGFANHYGHASPLQRNKLSNVAGYILVLTSHLMVFGSSLVLFLAGGFMLMGCIGDIYLCRVQRVNYYEDTDQLKDLTISLLMNATSNRHFVHKLLKYSKVDRYCKDHVGIGGLAGMKPKDLQAALDKIVEYQTDMARHYQLNIDGVRTDIEKRAVVIKEFKEEMSKVDLKGYIDDDLALHNLSSNYRHEFKELVSQSFLDFTLGKSDDLKNDISLSIADFDNVGSCGPIISIFEEGFQILCNGMLDFMNGYWLSMVLLTCIFTYGVYISISASKYLYTMKSYTYEGEPVAPEPTAQAALTDDERLRGEDAERMRKIRLRKAMMAVDTQLKFLVPLHSEIHSGDHSSGRRASTGATA